MDASPYRTGSGGLRRRESSLKGELLARVLARNKMRLRRCHLSL
jgi:hypothetical protein